MRRKLPPTQQRTDADKSSASQELDRAFFSEPTSEHRPFFQPAAGVGLQAKLGSDQSSFFQSARTPLIQRQHPVDSPKSENTQLADQAVAAETSKKQGLPDISPLPKQGTPLIQASFGEVPATPGWRQRVQQAGRDHTQMALLNEVFTRIYPDIQSRFTDLRLPVQPHRRGQEVDGGVYYDATQTDPGMTDQRTVTTGGSCSGCACTPTENPYVRIYHPRPQCVVGRHT
jgi:hypothetical protein